MVGVNGFFRFFIEAMRHALSLDAFPGISGTGDG